MVGRIYHVGLTAVSYTHLLLKKLRPLSDKECMDVIRDVQKNYRLPGKARTIGLSLIHI